MNRLTVKSKINSEYFYDKSNFYKLDKIIFFFNSISGKFNIKMQYANAENRFDKIKLIQDINNVC